MQRDEIDRAVARISFQILEKHPGLEHVVFVGIRTCGAIFAEYLQKKVSQISGIELPLGSLDISLYRDDLGTTQDNPNLLGTEIPFSISGAKIILCDDIYYTGRTIRAALDALIDFGRPACVELAVLVDRGHREFPIRPDYVGRSVETGKSHMVKVKLRDAGREDAVYIIPSHHKS